MLATFTPPAIVQPAEVEFVPTEADRRERNRHSTLSDALHHWPELAALIQTARMLPEFVGLVEPFDGYAEPAAMPVRVTEATF